LAIERAAPAVQPFRLQTILDCPHEPLREMVYEPSSH
jgi:hypothetical protein